MKFVLTIGASEMRASSDIGKVLKDFWSRSHLSFCLWLTGTLTANSQFTKETNEFGSITKKYFIHTNYTIYKFYN